MMSALYFPPAIIACPARPHAIDGDDIRCGRLNIRLASIDAPEMPSHCRPGRRCTPGDPFAARAELDRLLGLGTVACRPTGEVSYRRFVSRCTVAAPTGTIDLSCAMVTGGWAAVRYHPLDWCGAPRRRRNG